MLFILSFIELYFEMYGWILIITVILATICSEGYVIFRNCKNKS